MANIRIDIASEFKDKGFKAAEKRTTSLTRKFDGLTRSAKRTFIAIAGFQALKRSVNAFAEEDRAAQKLATSLRNLGLAYNTKAIEDYLEQSEKATAISKDQLSPAISLLISTTLDAQKSMTLLNLAMDISTATGKDLNSVTMGLTRAYNGNYAALGKVQTAYTAAELKALGFEASVKALSEQFSGAAQQNATTYSGKIELLRIAFEDLAEEIGKGIVAFLTSLGSGDYDKGLQKLVNFGAAIGDAFRRAGLTIEYTKALLSTGFRIDEEEMRKLEEIKNRFQNPQAATNRAGNSPAANRAFLNDMRKQQALQKKIEADRKKAADLAAKAEKERLKREKEAAQLKRAGTVFDIENIQIVAALQGKVTEEQRLRLTALYALNTGNAQAAEALTKAILAANTAAFKTLGVTMDAGDSVDTLIQKIIKAQTNLFLINTKLTEIPEAKNPFDKWQDIIASILAGISQITNAVNNMPAAPANPLANNSATNPPGIIGNDSKTPYSREEWDLIQNRLPPELREPYDSYLKFWNASRATNNPSSGNQGATNENYGNDLASGPISGGGGMGALSVNVNVSGSIISENDLVSSITNAIYNRQKSGQPITYSTSI